MVACGCRLLWPSGETHECPGAAIVHVLFANGDQRPVCFDCLRLVLQSDVTDAEQRVVASVAFHPLTTSCVADRHRWLDRACL